jgi:hypothetical protein
MQISLSLAAKKYKTLHRAHPSLLFRLLGGCRCSCDVLHPRSSPQCPSFPRHSFSVPLCYQITLILYSSSPSSPCSVSALDYGKEEIAGDELLACAEANDYRRRLHRKDDALGNRTNIYTKKDQNAVLERYILSGRVYFKRI